MHCDIIIPVWNELEITRDCVDSITRCTSYPYRVIIVDNGSSKPTADYLDSLKEKKGLNLLLIRNSSNLGFVKAVNQGMIASDAPYLCIMNNDTTATKGWLEELVDIMDSHPEIGLLNPSSNTSGQFPQSNESIDDYAARLNKYKGEIQELYRCRGFCMLLRRSAVEKIGLLDEIYHFGYFDETDYCKRAQELGYRTARAKAAYVYHKENVSFKNLKDNKELFWKNEALFFKRWGKPLRVGYFLNRGYSPEKVNDIAIQVARNGHQILIFLKRGDEWPVKLDHFDIRRFDLNPLFFNLASIYKILRRKRKKKMDVLLTDDARFGAVLNRIKSLHEADVLINPERDCLLNLLTKKSKQL